MAVVVADTRVRCISPEEAAGLVRSGMWLDYGGALCQPDVFDKALAARKAELRDVKIRSSISVKPRAVLEADPHGEHFFWFSWHFSGYDRKQHDSGRCNHMPNNVGELPDYYRRFLDPVDIVILKTCPMDEDGYFNFGPTNGFHGTPAVGGATAQARPTTKRPESFADGGYQDPRTAAAAAATGKWIIEIVKRNELHKTSNSRRIFFVKLDCSISSAPFENQEASYAARMTFG